MNKIALVLAACLVLGACNRDSKPAGPPGAPSAPPPEVDVLTVTPGAATLTQDLPGRLQAYRTAEVRARVEGIVEKRLFREGSDVKAGALLFQIDPRPYRTAYEAARADVAAARLLVDRYKPLVDMKAVSQQEYDAAVARQKQAEAALTKAELDLENTRVPAPISGRIGRALVTEGALVGRGEATHMATIEQIDPIYANFTQSSADVLRLRDAVKAGRWKEAEGARVELVQENDKVYPLQGRLLFSDLAVDPATGAVSLRAQFPNPSRELLPGMFVRVRFPQGTSDAVIRVPQRAVQLTPQGSVVMIVDKDGKVAPRPVKTGGMSGSDWVISEGLAPGEQVIVDGQLKAPPGTPVKPVPWSPPGSGPAAASNAAGAPGAAAAPAPTKPGN